MLLGAAGLVRLALGERRLAVQEAVLRAALVGGFVTASLQVGLDVRPIGGRLAVPAPRRGPRARAGARPDRPSNGADATAPGVWRGRPVAVSSLPPWATGRRRGRDPPLEGRPRGRVGRPRARRPRAASPWPPSGCGACCATAGGCVPGELDPGALAAAHALGLHRPVLSEARHLSVPLATGVLRPEVCLPPRALGELGADEQVALCAHELAHLARRDPAWVLLARLVEALAPFQPMNAWARRRLSDLAECLSDDLAVSALGRPLGLARSLVDVASWTLGERPFLPVAASGALSVRSRLGHRVERLMDPARTVERPRRALLPAAALVVLATALVTPVVSGSAAPSGPAAAEGPARTAGSALAADAALAAGQPSQPTQPSQPSQAALQPDAPSQADAEEQIQALSRQIEARVHLHAADMKALEAEIEAIVSKIQPAGGRDAGPGPGDREGRPGASPRR